MKAGPNASSRAAASLNYATSPLLASKTPPWRSRFVVLLVGIAFVVLMGRALWVQVIHSDFYQAQGAKRFTVTQALPASRGQVLDRHGAVLATSVAMPTVQVDMRSFEADVAKRKALARLVGLSAAELDERLEGATGTVVLKRHVEEPVWQAVQALKIKGVPELREYKRRWPEGESAVHVVGFTDVEEQGQEGIERQFQEVLEGTRGQRTVMRDRLGKVIEDLGTPRAAANGRDVRLSIDAKVQFFAWQQLRNAAIASGAVAGSVVVLDTQTGELLALANYPSADPNDRRARASAATKNLALTDMFEPGSTIKPFTVALALQTQRVTPTTLVDTGNGTVQIGDRTIRDTHAHGTLTVAQVVQKSSNVGTVKLAMRMKPAEMWDWYTQLGFGLRPHVEFPVAARGRLPPASKWVPVNQATIGYGMGLSVSLVQLARAYSVFARDGEMVPLTLLARPDGGLVKGQRVMSVETARQVREMLALAVQSGGTGGRAETTGYSIAGKTGTARRYDPKLRGYGDKHIASFVGMAPLSSPRLVVAVMLDSPKRGGYYGGDIAAPVFSQVTGHTLRLMNVAPDIEVKPQTSGKALVIEGEGT
jgi:cell division protein FtsI (penicillin-binding protein 3)